MKQLLRRMTAGAALLALLLGLLPVLPIFAEKAPAKVSGTAVTSIVLADAYDSIASATGTTIYLETTLGPAYFDCVRTGDTLTLRVDVEKAGTYQWCMVTGWANSHVNGTFTLLVDGNEAGTIVNEVPGADWRTWLDTTPGTVTLPAGEHELTIRFGSDGPNVYGIKFAPEGVDMKVEGGYVKLCGGNDNTPVSVSSDCAVQFRTTVPFDSLAVRCPSWNNNKGSLRFELLAWNDSYEKTTAGTPILTEDFIDYPDNATLEMTSDTPIPLGEYILRISNISEDGAEQVGVWASPVHVENVRNYVGGVEAPNAASLNIHYIGSTSTPLGSISANLQETPVYEEITASQKDLSQYRLPASSRYLTAEVMPDTWVFVDGLGRVSLTNADVGDPRDDKTVAMFFWNWHATFGKIRTPFNVQGYIDRQTAAGIPLEDYLYDYDHAGWLAKDHSVQYFWDEPIYGYYRSDDTWVIRRQAELLTAAGVDVIFTDNTNATLTWGDSYPLIYKTFTEAMADGVDTPKISNYMPFAPGNDTALQLREMYTNIYHDGNYRPLWFYWDGKPMLAAHGIESLKDNTLDNQIAEFFTFRPGQPDYFVKSGIGNWGWLSAHRQACYYATEEDRRAGVIEQISVGVAQNANYTNKELAAMSGHDIMGRSYTRSYRDRYVKEGDEASKWGYNFAEQWEYALDKDPKLVFVTGWNEWCASRYASWPDGGHSVVTNAFPDQFNNEFSRDIEPSRGDLADHYYYQLTNFVRQYKGARPIPSPSQNVTIDMSAGIDQWAAVEPYYAANIGNTDDRDADGYKCTHYTEYSGRNDIIGAQIARDGENLWFLVECAESITPYTDNLWMNLYIDVDGENAGWNSFDFVVNKTAPTATTAVLEKFTGDGYASEKVADVAYTVDGRYMTICIPKSALGLAGNDYTVNFAWTDNVHDVADAGTKTGEDYTYTTFSGDILDFYTSGDVAPGGRFKFSFISTAENSGEDSESTETGGESTPAETLTPDTDAQQPPAETNVESDTDTETVLETSAETPAVTSAETSAATNPPEASADDDSDQGCASTATAACAVLATSVAAACILRRRKDD